ncbi:type 1 fimbrial protein [Salmonella enterica]|nr:type 1 fimbrial protein [Salmonella enterica]ELC4947000.1 type 1 fimbrial protein [Salmonella enterica]ELI8702840.1 type 1 fimbrial protein [Salmonella enterica]
MRAITMGCLMVVAAGVSLPALADVDFTGNLLDRPCQVDPASSSQEVLFLDTAVPLYQVTPGRSSQKPFVIRLINCHATTVGKTVKLVFSGQGEPALPGYLAVTGVNNGYLGIGIVDTDSSTLLKPGDVHHLGAGDTVTGDTVTLNFKAYVQASPQAIVQRSVQPGDYSATATFTLNYQ